MIKRCYEIRTLEDVMPNFTAQIEELPNTVC